MKCLSAQWSWIVAWSALILPRVFAARDVPVNIVVDFTDEGRKQTHPTRSAPAYYFPIAAGFQELGGLVAGEKPPDQKEVLHGIALALAAQGYLVTQPGFRSNANGELTYADGTPVEVPANPNSHGHSRMPPRAIPLTVTMVNSADGPYSMAEARKAAPSTSGPVPPLIRVVRTVDPVHGSVLDRMPSLILMIRYGYMNPNIVDMGGRGQKIFFNADQMLGLVGGNAFTHITLDFEREDIIQAAQENRYFITVAAYDYPAYAASRKKVMLWQAKISTPSGGLESFSDITAALVAAGTASFGRETHKPVVVYLHRTPDGTVDIGPLTVKGVSEPEAPTPAPRP
jgi:hypothetical protein